MIFTIATAGLFSEAALERAFVPRHRARAEERGLLGFGGFGEPSLAESGRGV